MAKNLEPEKPAEHAKPGETSGEAAGEAKAGDKIYLSLDKPAAATEQLASLYRELRSDPAAFRAELQKVQARTASDGIANNDLEIVYDRAGAVSEVSIKRDWARDPKIFDRTDTDKYLKAEELQKIEPEKARTLVEPLMANDGDKKSSLFQTIDNVLGTGDGSINREKLEAFLLKDVKPEPENDPTHIYNPENREAVKKILSQWDSEEFRHLRGVENRSAWSPNFSANESLKMSRLSQIFGKQGDALFQDFPRQSADLVTEAEMAEYDKTPSQKLAEYYAQPHSEEEIQRKNAEIMSGAGQGTLFLARHPEFMAQVTKETPIVPGSNHMLTYFDMDKINRLQTESPQEMAVIEGFKVANVFLQEWGRRHSYDPTAPRGLDSLPVDNLVKMLYYTSDPSINSYESLRKRLQAANPQG